ncbi:MAG: transcriptional regulator PadR family [Haloplasmataceae bacterium]|jgi:DNA-binding PadR family transcriptional regulator|nr:transcriptional regulator PadR family [Haloplasmataceae bacterium]
MYISKDLTAASATPLLLAILKEQDSYGYEIIKRIKEISHNEMEWTEGMLYPVLHRLEEQQLIESYWKSSESGRKRKYYHLKEAGLEELNNQIKQWDIVHFAISETLINKQK